MCGNKKTSRNVFRPQLLSPGKNPLGLAWVGPPWSFDKHPFAADFRLYFGSKSRIRFLLLPQLRIFSNLNRQKDLDYFFVFFFFSGFTKGPGLFTFEVVISFVITPRSFAMSLRLACGLLFFFLGLFGSDCRRNQDFDNN